MLAGCGGARCDPALGKLRQNREFKVGLSCRVGLRAALLHHSLKRERIAALSPRVWAGEKPTVWSYAVIL